MSADLRLRQFRAAILLPVMVTGVIPAVIVNSSHAVNVGWSLQAPFGILPVAAGLLLCGAGLTLAAQSIRLFGTEGQGTLAPWDPPRSLVVRGVYRHVRNPMISGLLGVLLGEAAFVGSWPLLAWFAAALALNLVYMPLVEEPGLERRFGQAYARYMRNVPAWIPRLSPWRPPDPEKEGS
jgi:protein-S-isoprenylcysteine O-methyltransferase Ste14